MKWLLCSCTSIAACFPGPLALESDVDGATTSTRTTDVASGTSDVSSDSGVTADLETLGDSEVMVDSATSSDETEVRECTTSDDCVPTGDDCSAVSCSDSGHCETTPLTGTECSDDDACTHTDRCAAGRCQGIPYQCDDGLDCTADRCDGIGGCIASLLDDRCYIDGACYDLDDRRPGQPCEACQQGTSWSAALDGACDDGDSCTLADSCAEGVCQSGRAPDDALAGDWMLFPATFEIQEGQGQQIHELMPDGDGIVVRGEFVGTASFANGVVVGSATTRPYLARIDASGAMTWLVTLSGATRIDLLGPDVSGNIAIALEGTAIGLDLYPGGGSWSVPTTVERPAAVVLLDGGGSPTGFAVSHMPSAMSPTNRTYGVLGFVSETLTFSGSGDATETLTRQGTRENLAVFSHDSAGKLTWARQIWIDDADVQSGDVTSLRALALAPRANGRSYVVVQSTHPIHVGVGGAYSDRLAPESPFAAVIEIDLQAFDMNPVVLMSGLHGTFGIFRNAMSIHPTATGFILTGELHGPSVTMGTGAQAVEHVSQQGFSPNGPVIVGSGGEGFVASYAADLSLSWVNYLEPTSAAGTALRGSGVEAVVLVGPDILIAGAFKDSGVLLGRSLGGRFYASLDGGGAINWAWTTEAGHAGLVPLATHEPALIGFGNSEGGPSGVGPTSIVIPDVPRGELPIGFLQRFNSEGGIACGVVEPE